MAVYPNTRASLQAKQTVIGGGLLRVEDCLVAGFFETSDNQFWRCTETAITLKCKVDVLGVLGFLLWPNISKILYSNCHSWQISATQSSHESQFWTETLQANHKVRTERMAHKWRMPQPWTFHGPRAPTLADSHFLTTHVPSNAKMTANQEYPLS